MWFVFHVQFLPLFLSYFANDSFLSTWFIFFFKVINPKTVPVSRDSFLIPYRSHLRVFFTCHSYMNYSYMIFSSRFKVDISLLAWGFTPEIRIITLLICEMYVFLFSFSASAPALIIAAQWHAHNDDTCVDCGTKALKCETVCNESRASSSVINADGRCKVALRHVGFGLNELLPGY